MTGQQKIWRQLAAFFFAVRPLLLYLFLPALLMAGGMMLRGGAADTEAFVRESGNFYYALGTALTFYILYRQCRKRGSSLFDEVTLYSRDLNRKKLVCLFAMGMSASLVISAVLTVIPLPQVLIQSYSGSSEPLYQGTDRLLTMAATVVLAPVVEEIIFRGYLMNRMLRAYSARQAVIVSSIIFGLCHVSALWTIYAFAMGVVLALVAMKEDNIIYAVFLHLGFNFNTIPTWLINHQETAKAFFFGQRWLTAVYGGIGAAILICCYREYRKEQ